MSETHGQLGNERLDNLSNQRLRQTRSIFFGAYLAISVILGINTFTEQSQATEAVATQEEVPLYSSLETTTTASTAKLNEVSINYSEGVAPFAEIIETSAEKYHVGACLMGAITERESQGKVYVEYGGTYGLMQLDPKTAEYMTDMYDISYNGDLYDPMNQFEIGASILNRAEDITGVDTNQTLTEEEIRATGIFYHGEGYYQHYSQGLVDQLPSSSFRSRPSFTGKL